MNQEDVLSRMSVSKGRYWTAVENVVGKITISVLFTFVVLYVADNVFNAVASYFSASKENYFPKDIFMEPRPFTIFGGTLDPELQKKGDLNAEGYRGPLPVNPKPMTEMRVAVIGGSTVLTGDPTLAELLEEHFERDGHPHVKVYNFGVAASTLRMDVARFVFEVAGYSPDLVVFYGGGNDIGMPYQADPRPGFPPNFLAYEANPLLTAGTRQQSWRTLFGLALLHSSSVRMLAGENIKTGLVPFAELRRAAGWNTEPWSQKISQVYLEDVKLVSRIADGLKTKVFFVFQPLLAFKPRRSPLEKLPHDLAFIQHANLTRTAILQGLKRIHETDGVFYADLSEIFDSTEEHVFLDEIHVRQQFQDILAAAVHKTVRGMLF